ncbi:MAG TPA: copper chaperone PCu(A)C [Moraxellaceae bacterium]|nr:copper chaperone PCu(A)C [Moraxellaceae bacterium]
MKLPVRSLSAVAVGVVLCAGVVSAALATPAPAMHHGATRSAVPVIENVWIAEAPPSARHNAAYLRVRNGARADTLLGVETPVAEVVELHAMTQEQGVMHMEQETSVPLAPGATLELAPGGRHLMLVNMKRVLKVGDRVPLTLHFRHAGLVTVEAVVRPLAEDDDMSPGNHASH